MRFKINNLNNFFGAFADIAIMLPIISLLSVHSGFSAPTLFLTSGMLYVFSSLYYRVPISIQPLKSIAISSLTLGASFYDVRMAGFLLGFIFVSLWILKIDKYLNKIPDSIVHQIQVGLGTLLLIQAYRSDSNAIIYLISAVVAFVPFLSKIPVLGIVAVIGLLFGLFYPSSSKELSINSNLHWNIIISLLLPQIILTLSNSVVATQRVCKTYFKSEAKNVKMNRLIFSIGFGNIISSMLAGLPFCHGSGGVTAHAKGGSRNFISTIVTGAFYIIFGIILFNFKNLTFQLHPVFISFLLATTGFYHMQLAKNTILQKLGIFKVITSILITVISLNLIYVLLFSIILEILENKYLKLKRAFV